MQHPNYKLNIYVCMKNNKKRMERKQKKVCRQSGWKWKEHQKLQRSLILVSTEFHFEQWWRFIHLVGNIVVYTTRVATTTTKKRLKLCQDKIGIKEYSLVLVFYDRYVSNQKVFRFKWASLSVCGRWTIDFLRPKLFPRHFNCQF